MARLHVATLNIRNLADRWPERLTLLLADMAALQPDVIGLQEVVYAMQQDRVIGSAGEAHYTAARAWAGRPEYGNSLLVKTPLVALSHDRLDLGRDRSALLTSMALPDAAAVRIVVTHLHALVPDEGVRDEQTATLLDVLGRDVAASGPTIVMGDFNADPAEPAYARMIDAGFRSAFAEANGAEPAVTWPSGLQGPAIDTDGDPACIDYIWIRGAIAVTDARLVFDRPDPDDPGLYPSDHFGIAAHLEIG